MERLFSFDHFWQALLTIATFVFGVFEYNRREELRLMRLATQAALEAANEAKAEAAKAKESAVQIAFKAGEALAEHKLFAAENFSRKQEVETALDKVEGRLRQQLAENQAAQIERLEEIRDRLPRRN